MLGSKFTLIIFDPKTMIVRNVTLVRVARARAT